MPTDVRDFEGLEPAGNIAEVAGDVGPGLAAVGGAVGTATGALWGDLTRALK